MKNIRKTLLVMRAGLQNVLLDRKVILLLLVIGFILDNGVRKMVDNAIQIGQPIGVFEAFIMCLNNWFYLIIFLIGFVFLLASSPRLDSNQILLIYRTGKKNWLLGEILQVTVCSLSYIVILLLGCMIESARYCFVGNVWSNYNVFYRTDYEKVLNDSIRFVDQQVFKYYMPYEAVLHSILLLTLCMTLMGTIIILFSIIRKKLIGILLNIILVLFVLIFSQYHSNMMWISPFCHAVLTLHNIYVYRELSVPLLYSYIYLIIMEGILVAVSLRQLKGKMFY